MVSPVNCVFILFLELEADGGGGGSSWVVVVPCVRVIPIQDYFVCTSRFALFFGRHFPFVDPSSSR